MEYNTEAFSHIIDVEILATPASCTDVYIVKEIELNMGLYFCWGGLFCCYYKYIRWLSPISAWRTNVKSLSMTYD